MNKQPNDKFCSSSFFSVLLLGPFICFGKTSKSPSFLANLIIFCQPFLFRIFKSFYPSSFRYLANEFYVAVQLEYQMHTKVRRYVSTVPSDSVTANFHEPALGPDSVVTTSLSASCGSSSFSSSNIIRKQDHHHC